MYFFYMHGSLGKLRSKWTNDGRGDFGLRKAKKQPIFLTRMKKRIQRTRVSNEIILSHKQIKEGVYKF